MEMIEEQFKKMKKMWEEGCTLTEIAKSNCTSISNVKDTFAIMGYSRKRQVIENLVYADNRVKLEKVVIDGKRYTDVTPIFSPR